MRAACDSLIGLLAIAVSGGYGQWTIKKNTKLPWVLSRTACRRGGREGGLLPAGSLTLAGVRLATGELEQGTRGRRKAGLREQSFILY